MQRRTKLIVALGAAGLIGFSAIAGSAFADRKRGDHGMRHGQHHGMMGGQFRTLAERYDLNQDGEISQEEIDQNRAQWHGEFAGQDAAMTVEEFQNLWLRARRLEMVREFQEFDRDGDGNVTLEEYQRPMAEFVERFDRTDNQSLSKDDFQRRGKDRRRGRSERGSSGDEQMNAPASEPAETQQQ